MSQQPEPPASIAKAIYEGRHRWAADWPEENFDAYVARVVWDALLAKGAVWYLRDSGADHWILEAGGDQNRVLVIPLPVVEARDATHLTPGGSA